MPPKKALTDQIDRLDNLIYEIRGQKVMLDADLAAVYGVTTANLNKAVKRNRDRFPTDFTFQLTPQEVASFHVPHPRNNFITKSKAGCPVCGFPSSIDILCWHAT